MEETQPLQLDVRPLLKQNRSPMSAVLAAVNSLGPDQDLLVIAPFEPVPMYKLLLERGLVPESRHLENGDWEILFRRSQ